MIPQIERRTPDGWLILPSRKPRTGLRACGNCAKLFHIDELRAGRGRQMDEHPEHTYAPCGCDVTYFGANPAFGASALEKAEVFSRCGLCQVCESPLTFSERPYAVCLCCSPVSAGAVAEGLRVAA